MVLIFARDLIQIQLWEAISHRFGWLSFLFLSFLYIWLSGLFFIHLFLSFLSGYNDKKRQFFFIIDGLNSGFIIFVFTSAEQDFPSKMPEVHIATYDAF